MGRRVYGCEMESDGVAIKEENDRDYGENMKLPVDEFRKVIRPEVTLLELSKLFLLHLREFFIANYNPN
jgi:hypothetical protein